MSNHEIPSGNPDSHDNNHEFEQAISQPDALLFGKLETLRDALEKKRLPNLQSREFQFIDDFTDLVVFPRVVQDHIDDGFVINSASIECASAGDTDPTTISYEFTFRLSNDDEQMVICIARPHYYVETPDEFDIGSTRQRKDVSEDEYDEDEARDDDFIQQIPPVSRAELNRYIASLIYSRPKNDYSVFDDHDWRFDNLIDNLALVADITSGEDTYVLTDAADNYCGELKCYLDGDLATQFNLVGTVYSDDSDRQKSAIDEVDVTISRYEEYATAYFRYQTMINNWSASVFSPTDPSFEALLGFVDDQNQR